MRYLFILLSFSYLSPTLGQNNERLFSFDIPARGIDAIQCADGSYMATGYTSIPDGGASNLLLLKLDKEGNEAWRKELEEEGKSQFGWSLVEVADGYLVAGFTEYNKETQALLLRVDKSGAILWRKELNKYPDQIAWSIAAGDEGSIVGVGEIMNGDKDNVWIYSLDYKGNMLWQHFLDSGDRSNRCFYIDKLKNGSYVVAGTSAVQSKVDDDLLVINFDKDGKLIWQKTIEVSEGRDVAHAVKVEDGDINVYGYTQIGNQQFNPLVISLDSKGNVLNKTIVKMDNMDVRIMNGISTKKGTLLVGYGRNLDQDFHNSYLLKVDGDGQVISKSKFGTRGRNSTYAIKRNTEGYFAIGSATKEAVRGSDVQFISSE